MSNEDKTFIEIDPENMESEKTTENTLPKKYSKNHTYTYVYMDEEHAFHKMIDSLHRVVDEEDGMQHEECKIPDIAFIQESRNRLGWPMFEIRFENGRTWHFECYNIE